MLLTLAAPLATMPATAAERSCEADAGIAKAATYVEHCILVSPATHPPCHAANPCRLILDEIRRGCGLIEDGGVEAPVGDVEAPAFCGAYTGRGGG